MKQIRYGKLRKLRVAYGYTITKMAEKLQISKGYYSLIENGKRRLFYDLAIEIAEVFDLKPDDIFYNK